MKKLELLFINEADKTVTYSLDNPVDPVDSETVSEVMDTIIASDIFVTSGGRLVKKKLARVVERTVDEVDSYE